MTEIELKFQVDTAALAGVEAALAAQSPAITTMHARYFDGPQRELARAGWAWRQRCEGGQWVQTLKGRAAGARGALVERLEHNAVLDVPAHGEPPALDLAAHAGTGAGQALAQQLQAAGLHSAQLGLQYETVFERRHAELVHEGARVELALDRGEIRAGARRLPLAELEFELLAGEPGALVALAAQWVAQHGLWLDLRSKAERGMRLALGQPAPAVGLPARRRDQGAAAALAPALEAVLRQQAALLEGDAPAPTLAALRGGVRRLLALHGGAELAAVRHQLARADEAGAARALRAAPVQQAWLTLLARAVG